MGHSAFAVGCERVSPPAGLKWALQQVLEWEAEATGFILGPCFRVSQVAKPPSPQLLSRVCSLSGSTCPNNIHLSILREEGGIDVMYARSRLCTACSLACSRSRGSTHADCSCKPAWLPCPVAASQGRKGSKGLDDGRQVCESSRCTCMVLYLRGRTLNGATTGSELLESQTAVTDCSVSTVVSSIHSSILKHRLE